MAGPNVAGLAPRLIAASRLGEVLGGAPFIPISADEIAGDRDRALANRLVTTALRRRGHIDIAMGRLLHRGLPARAPRFEPVLRLALAQLLFLPELGAHSALYLAGAALATDRRSAHLKGLMNAVLRRAQAERDALVALPPELLFPEWLRERWAGRFGDEALVAFAEALRATPPLDLTLKRMDAELIDALGAAPLTADTVRLVSRDRPVAALPGYDDGHFWVQDAAAAMPARLFDLPAGARVLDFCAAPGGKTAQLCKAGYRVTALDKDARRLDRLAANLARLGFSAEIVNADAAEFRPEVPFDGVLLDAPCSATGTFRRHPELVFQRRPADIAGRAELQRRLVANAVRCLAPSGILVYCVCSLEPEEGEDRAAWIGRTFPELEPRVVAPGTPGVVDAAITPPGFVRTHPGQLAGGLDGFFIARFQKTGA